MSWQPKSQNVGTNLQRGSQGILETNLHGRPELDMDMERLYKIYQSRAGCADSGWPIGFLCSPIAAKGFQ